MVAGMSSRMGEFKPLLQLGQVSMIQHMISTFAQAGADPVVVVTGYQAKLLEQHLKQQPVHCIYNAQYATTEMFDSAKIGMGFLNGKCDRFFFTPADIPLFTVNTLQSLMKSEHRLAKPVFHGKGGHPLLIDASLIGILCADQTENGGLKEALKKTGEKIERIAVENDGILFDMDTKEDYLRMIQDRKIKKKTE